MWLTCVCCVDVCESEMVPMRGAMRSRRFFASDMFKIRGWKSLYSSFMLNSLDPLQKCSMLLTQDSQEAQLHHQQGSMLNFCAEICAPVFSIMFNKYQYIDRHGSTRSHRNTHTHSPTQFEERSLDGWNKRQQRINLVSICTHNGLPFPVSSTQARLSCC